MLVAVAIFWCYYLYAGDGTEFNYYPVNMSNSLKIDELTLYSPSRLDPAPNFLKWT